MTEEEREALVTHWLDVELDDAEECRAVAGPISDAYRWGQLEGLDIMQEQAEEDLMGNDHGRIEKDADALIKSAGLPPLDHDSAEYGRLCRRLLQARIEYTRIEAERWNGNYRATNHRPVAIPTISSSTPTKPKAPTGPTFTEVVNLYFKENTRAQRTDDQVKAEFEKFLTSIGGDRGVGLIGKAECRAYKDDMLNTRKLGLTTVIKHLCNLSVLFKWSEAQGFIPEHSNPVRGLSPTKKAAKRQALKRKTYTDEQLLQVFGSPEFKQERDGQRPERYWIAVLCLFLGCRREEAAQLAVVDIQEEEGMPFVRINDDAKLGQSLKNDISRRRVPLSNAVIRLGFLDDVNNIRKAGHVRLFPHVVRSRSGYGDATGKWWGRLMTAVGLPDPELVLHGLRHTTITNLHAAGCPENIARMLTGHSEGNVHGQYVHRERIPLTVLRDGLNKLRYDDVVKRLMV